jgi:hypothetical protein
MSYTVADVRRIVGLNLGDGRSDIELDAAHFDRALDAALKAMSRYLPQHGYVVIPVNPGGNKYKLVIRNLLGVLNCEVFTGGIRLEEAPYYTRWVDRMLELGDMEQTQRVFGDQPEWHWQMEVDPVTYAEEAWLYVQFTRSSFTDTFARIPTHACVQFAWHIEPTDDRAVGVCRIPYDMRQWVEDFATAKCRTILGEIRGKFGGVPGQSDESVMPGDGAAQVARGEAAMAALMEDLRLRRRQMPLTID